MRVRLLSGCLPDKVDLSSQEIIALRTASRPFDRMYNRTLASPHTVVSSHSMDHASLLERHIPYRLQSVGALALAWKWWSTWDKPKETQIFFDGALAMVGNSNAILNPMMEAGFVHARALLEFLGLGTKNGKLVNISNRRPDDIGIEHFSVGGQPLSQVTPEAAIGTYLGPPEDAEQALLAVFHIANKGFAHFSAGLTQGRWSKANVSVACEGIPILVINHLYVPLGLPAPEYMVRSNPR